MLICDRLTDQNKEFDDVLDLVRDEKEELKELVKCGDKTYRAISGEVSVERAVCRKKGEHNAPLVSPLEMRWGIVDGGWTPRAAEAMGHLSQKMPEDEAKETSQQLGCLPYSTSSFAHIGRTLGEVCPTNVQSINEALIEAADLPESTHSIAVSVDRVSLPLDESDTPA